MKVATRWIVVYTGLLFVLAAALKLHSSWIGFIVRLQDPFWLTPFRLGFWGFLVLVNWEFAQKNFG